MPQSEPLPPDINSKSQRKKDMLALQKLGESLILLSESQLKEIEMPEILLIAILDAKNFQAEARRRQLQYIGKLMRSIDAEPIKIALKKIQFTRESNASKFKRVEQWREKLIVGGDQRLNQFLTEYPDTDRQQLRQIIRKAQTERKNNKNLGAEKLLFKFLVKIID